MNNFLSRTIFASIAIFILRQVGCAENTSSSSDTETEEETEEVRETVDIADAQWPLSREQESRLL